MSYLLDTNVISESERLSPDVNVLAWLGSVTFDQLHISALTVGEIKKGIVKLPAGRRKAHLQEWFEELREKFFGRVFPLTEKTFVEWGFMVAKFEQQGIVRPPFDSLIEATALEHDLVLVTRNVRNFQYSSVTILNPWEISFGGE
ncbi:MAG: type II toxin-antitoxin system VapC family toxin [Pyrinomonadaceae bacterium]